MEEFYRDVLVITFAWSIMVFCMGMMAGIIFF